MTVPGVGPLIASAMVAAIGNGTALPRAVTCRLARLSAEQMSTGDRTILGRISKHGNRYLRMLSSGARVICQAGKLGKA